MVFTGYVDEHGKLHIDAVSRFRERLRNLADARVELEIRRPRRGRSAAMNAYLHSETGPIRLMADFCGEDMEGMKYALMGQCFGWVYSAVAQREVPVQPHTSAMSVEDATYFLEWVVPFAAKHGVMVALPGDYLAKDEDQDTP